MIPYCKKQMIKNGALRFSSIRFLGEKEVCGFAQKYLGYFLEEEILLSLNDSVNVCFRYDESLQQGGYRLQIADNCEICYGDDEGVRNALATLIVLMQYKDGAYILPCQDIEDYPDCLHRGVMIDLARGLPNQERLKEDLKRLSLAKCNKVHFHLMDEEGICYRSEVLPFEEEIRDTKIYSKQDLKNLVTYCKDLGIQVIPEIEFPAHANALTKIYPQLKCQTSLEEQSGWTVCMGNEATYVFFEKLIEEVCEIFPSEYIHIGGDEHAFNDVPALRRWYYWNDCKVCRERMEKENLANERELFYYGVKRLHAIVKKAGRKMILWNDELDVSKPIDIPKDVTVQYWRIANENRGPRKNCSYKKLLQQGFDVICSPFEYLYIELEKYANPEKIASFDYKAYGNGEEYAQNVIGCEVCAWEYGNPAYSHYLYSFTPSTVLLLAKMWDRKDVVFNKAYRETLTKLVIGVNTPKNYNLFELFGSIMPPRIKGQITYATMENELMDKETLLKHKQILSEIPYTYSPLYLQGLKSLCKGV